MKIKKQVVRTNMELAVIGGLGSMVFCMTPID